MRVLLCCAVLALSPVAALAAEKTSAPPPLEAFARLPAAEAPQISPDGRHLAFLSSVGGTRMLVVKTLLAEAGASAKDQVIAPSEGDIRNFAWAKNDRLVLAVRGVGRRLKGYNVPGSDISEERRLLAVDLDGGNSREIGRRRLPNRLMESRLGDLVMGTLPDDPDNILMLIQETAGTYASVARVNVRTGERDTVQVARPYVTSWIAGPDGTVRAGVKIRDSVITIIAPDGKGDWVDIHSQADEEGRSFKVLGAGIDRDILYVASRHEGDRWAIYEFSIAQRKFLRTLAADPRFDIDGTVMLDGMPVGTIVQADLPEQLFFDPVDQQMIASIDKALPGTRENLSSRSRDGRFMVISSQGPASAPRFHLFDAVEKRLTPLGDAYPELSGVTLGRRAATAYPARDGRAIPAIITLPPGKAPQKLPFIILPHGGPALRDDLGFDWMAQFLASRGYGVIQPNFRGSTGYGLDHEQAGRGQWGRAMQDDLVDAVAFLADQGLADRDRICMVGASYGGYAAMMAGWRDPGLFRCAISINGLSDLTKLFDNFGGSSRRDSLRASLGESRDALSAVSPVNMAARLTTPILLIHGEHDTVAPADHSRDMADALRSAGKPVRFEEIEDGSHWLLTAQERIRVLKAVEAFLAEHLGAPS